MKDYILWEEWIQAFSCLRGAFSRQTTFLWCMVICAGFTVRRDLAGVSSVMRALRISNTRHYHSLLRTFRSNGVDRKLLVKLWLDLAMKLFDPMCIDGKMVFICDGCVVPKEGRRMPGVKLLHQSSSSNAKAEFVMGHYIGAVSLGIVAPNGKLTSVPIAAQLQDGIVRTHRGKLSTIDKMASMTKGLGNTAGIPAIIIGDAFFATKSMAQPLLRDGHHLLSRVKNNAVAYLPVMNQPKKKVGRPRIKGPKVKLASLFEDAANSDNIIDDYRYTHADLYWPGAGQIVRFVASYDTKMNRKCLLVTTDASLPPEQVIKLYVCRWSIESSFKTAKHTFGTFSYHFWSKSMPKQARTSNGTRLVGRGAEYRNKIEAKVNAFHLHMSLGMISHGLCTYFSLHKKDTVWKSFGGWIRSINRRTSPSESIVANALQSTLPDYLRAGSENCAFTKFLRQKIRSEKQDNLGKVA